MCKPSKDKRSSSKDRSQPTSLLSSKLQKLYLNTEEGQVDLSSRVAEAVKRSSRESSELNKLQEEYEQLSANLSNMGRKLASRKEESMRLEKEVTVLKHMFIANQMDIDEFNRVLNKPSAE